MADGRPSSLGILFIGDPEAVSAAIVDEIGTDSGVHLSTADSVENALEQTDSSSVDCIVGDEVGLADVDGSIERLRQSLGDIPIIILVDGHAGPVLESLAERGVSEVIPIDGIGDPASVVSRRVDYHIGRYRRHRLNRALGYQVRQLVDHAEDVVWILSDDWEELLYANPSFERIWGQRLEEVYAQPLNFLDSVHPTDRPAVRRAMDRLSSGEEIEIEYRVNRQEDYGRWVWMKGYPITDGDGEVIAVSGFSRDISVRKEQERRYRRERDRLINLFEHFPEPTIAYRFDDGVSRIEVVNEAFERVFGYSAEEAVGSDVDALIAPTELRDEAAALDDRVRAGEFVDTEVRRSTTGGDRHFRFRNIELPADDELDGFAIYADIDGQKRRERTMNALHATSRRLSGAQEHTSVAEIATEAAGEVIELPWAGTWLTDAQTDQLEPVSLTDDLQDALDAAPTLSRDEPIVAAVDEHDEYVVDDTAEDDDWPTELAPIRSAMVLSLGDHGVFIVADPAPDGIEAEHRTSARVLAANTEAAFERADREIALREQRQELSRQNDRLEEFTGVVSHDLRTPLAVAMGTLEQLSYEHEDLDTDHVEEALERMDAIISGTLTLARSGRITGDIEPVDLGEIARRCKHAVSTTGADVVVAEDLPVVDADPDRLKHVFENLYRNALDHAGEEVTITVEATDDGFCIADDGPGIPEEDYDLIFETGFSTDTDGTGFGLAIVHRIAEAHGWSIDVEESADGGAAFRFTVDD